MDNSEEVGHPESDADRPVESAGANGDGAPDSDDKGSSGRNAVPNDIHHGDGEDAIVISDIEVEEGSDAEQFLSVEDDVLPQGLQEGTDLRAAADDKHDPSPLDRTDGGESGAESVSLMPNFVVDPTSDTKVAESESETNTDVTLPSHLQSSATSSSQSKESELQLDSLNTSDSTLETVSCDGSFQSGNSLVLKGDTIQAALISPREELVSVDSHTQTEEKAEVQVISEKEISCDDDDDDDDDDDKRSSELPGDFSQNSRIPAFGNEEEVDYISGDEDGGIQQQSTLQYFSPNPNVQQQADPGEGRVESSPRSQLSSRSDADVGVTVTRSDQSIFSHDSLDEPAVSSHATSAKVSLSETGPKNSEDVDEDGFCQGGPQGAVQYNVLPDPPSPGQRHPEFPFNYNNYKVCRQVQPGIKECLILETGEHVTCKKSAEPEQESDGLSDSDSSSDQSSPNQSSMNNNSIVENKEGKTQVLSPNSKSGFKIIHKNLDGAVKFGNLVLSPNEPEADISGLRNRSTSESSSPRQRGTRSPHSYSERSVTNEMENTDQQSPRAATDHSVTGEKNERGGASPRSGTDRSVTREISSAVDYSSQTTSESSSARESESVNDLADLSNVQDIYETESDLRPYLEGGTRMAEDRDYTRLLHSADSRYLSRTGTSFSQTRSPITSSGFHSTSRADTRQEDQIDMSALHRADRWLGDRGAPVSPVRHNLSTSLSSTGTGPIPGFRTLQEQQASWMKMFKMLEDQHQSDLLTQYKQHQRNIQHLQEQIEDDLCRQQDNFQKKLDVHREILLQNASIAGSYIPPDFLPDGGDELEESALSGPRMATLPRPFLPDDDVDDRIQVVSDRLISGTPLMLDERRADEIQSSSRGMKASPRRLLEESYGNGSPRNLASSRAGIQGMSSHVLGGGVYSTPLHLTKSSHQFSPVVDPVQSTSLRGSDLDDENDDPRPPYRNLPQHSSMLQDTSLIRSQRGQFMSDSRLQHVSPPAAEGNTSSNARVSLREKHAKHLSDLRSYYEQELQELRAALTSPEYIKSQSPYKQVMEENLQLQNRLENQEDDIGSLKRVNRELENKIHTLQIRQDDTLEKYEECQVTIATLRHHLDDTRVLCKEKEAVVKNLEADNDRLSVALKEAYKVNDQQIAEARKEELAMNRLAERYENLHRENESNKEALNQMDGKLYDSRMEIVQLKRMISKLELDNNRINRENNNLRHKGLISSLGLSTFYPMSPQESGIGFSTDGQTPSNLTDPRRVLDQSTPDVSEIHQDSIRFQDGELSNGELDMYKTSPRFDITTSPPSRDVHRSPLVKAEEDLLNLRRTVKENLGQSLAQQRSLPRSSMATSRANREDQEGGNSGGRSSLSNSQRSSKSSPSSSKGISPKQVSNGVVQTVDNSHTTIIDTLRSRSTPQRKLFSTDLESHVPSGGTPTRFDIDIRPAPGSQGSSRKRSSPVKKNKPESGTRRNNKDGVLNPAVQTTLEKIRAGGIATRPSWENRDTTTVKSTNSQPRPKVREDKLQERMNTIRDMETKYDQLQMEKRQLESALSKVPISGKISHHNRKEKEDLDNRLDKVERELGSVRMSLKRYHVLKTGH